LGAVLIVGRLLLAGVFTVSAGAKLADRRGSQTAVREFGVPRALVPAATVGLPLFELVVAGLLLPQTTARWGAIGGLGLLGAFSVAIGFALAKGRHPDCHCFGQLHSAPSRWRTSRVTLRWAGLRRL